MNVYPAGRDQQAGSINLLFSRSDIFTNRNNAPCCYRYITVLTRCATTIYQRSITDNHIVHKNFIFFKETDTDKIAQFSEECLHASVLKTSTVPTTLTSYRRSSAILPSNPKGGPEPVATKASPPRRGYRRPIKSTKHTLSGKGSGSADPTCRRFRIIRDCLAPTPSD